MKKKILIAVVAVLIFFTGLFCSRFIKPPSSGVRYTDSKIATKAETSYITIQGFSELHFSANEITQDFKFQNPNDNDCYMNIIFCLPDGEVLFFIGNIQPSYGIEQVELNRVLDAGTYENCKLYIKCFSFADNRELNGATMAINLYVK